jgi:hypothetical protein
MILDRLLSRTKEANISENFAPTMVGTERWRGVMACSFLW